MTTRTPTLADALTRAAELAAGGVLVSRVARVDSYDRTDQTITATPIVADLTDLEDGGREALELPTISGIPVIWPAGGGVSITWELKPGDLVLLLGRDRSHDEVDAGRVAPPVVPSSSRRFSWSDVVALPGYRSPADPLPSSAVAATAVVVTLPLGATIKIGSSSASEAIGLADLIDARISAIVNAFNLHTHPSPAGATGVPVSLIPAQATTASTRLYSDG
jgi:hypothetical protein